jgi:transcriptional regulator with XRE-family HTH domain
MKNLGAKIRNLRVKANLSQEALAQKINTTKITVHRIETNQFDPSAATIIKIAHAFNVSTDSLLLSKEDIKKQQAVRSDHLGRFKAIENLNVKDQKILLNIIDTYLNTVKKTSTPS